MCLVFTSVKKNKANLNGFITNETESQNQNKQKEQQKDLKP